VQQEIVDYIILRMRKTNYVIYVKILSQSKFLNYH